MFSFRLATTSYIIPAPILPNLRLLGQHLDEIELVLFESGEESNLPSLAEVREMQQLAGSLDLTYNVHLPVDVFLGDPDPRLREKFIRTILRFYERVLPLEPELFILHLDSRSADGRENQDWSAWRDRVTAAIEVLMREGLDPHRVAVENLEYPLELIVPVIERFGLQLCLDIGHLLRYGYEVTSQLECFLARSAMVHLHGVRDGVDHCGLEWVAAADWEAICRALASYQGGVSLEVFALDDLISSLARLQNVLTMGKKCQG
jgi:sugar phosphate isomerase/epimerase